MIISLIGMSNIGKSYWSKKLEQEIGFKRFSVDEMIGEKLLLKLGINLHDETALSQWMGQPWEAQYLENSNMYIEFENEVVQSILDNLIPDKPIVIDTTGSVIYLDPSIIRNLKALSKVIYLECSHNKIDKMIENYIASPKPVFWADQYQSDAKLNQADNLAINYRRLLKARAKEYQTIADEIIEYGNHQNTAAGMANLLRVIND